MKRIALALALAAMLAGCATVPTPRDAMQAVSSPHEWSQAEAVSVQAATALQPTLLWQAEVAGQPHRLWWQGETLLTSSREPNTFADRYLQALSLDGRTLWEGNLTPGELTDATVDDHGIAYLVVVDTGVKGSILSLDRTGQERWRVPWENEWPRTIAAERSGQCVVVGTDGRSGAFPGGLHVLGPDGAPLFPSMQTLLVGFAGWPSKDCSRFLTGYESAGTGLYQRDLYRGTGVHLLDQNGQVLESVINYHRPLAMSQDGETIVIMGVPSADRAYQPPTQDSQPAPPFGQVLWLDAQARIQGRYRLPFAATVDAFHLTDDGKESLLLLTTHRYAGGARPEEIQRIVWLNGSQVAWQRDAAGRVLSLHIANTGRAALLAEEAPAGGAWLTLLDRSGKVVWRYHSLAPLVAVQLSPTGDRAAVFGADGLSLFDTRLSGEP